MKRSQIISGLVLVGMVSSIATTAIAFSSGSVSETLIAKGDRELDLDGVPRSVQRAAIADLSRRENIPQRQIRIVEATRKTWPDSCLGLPRPDELCAQVLTEGWRLVLTDGSDRWVYRTNDTGSTVRLESAPNSPTTDLPRSVADAVLQAVSRRVGTSQSNFRIVKAVRQTWPDGCLGVPQPGRVCTQALVEGWEVTAVSDRNSGQRWIYRTDRTGGTVILANAYDAQSNVPRSQPNSVLSDREMPQPLTRGMVFRAIASGGIAGRTYETVLMEDGTLIQVLQGLGNANDIGRRVGRISPKQMQQFERLLSQQQFEDFDRLNFPAPNGAADYITVTLSSPSSTIRYADLSQEQLPENLQQVIQSWNRIVSRIGR